MAGLGKTRSGADSAGGRKKRGEPPKPPPPSQSGGTSGDLSIPGYVPATPTVPYNPSEPAHAAQDFAEAFHTKEAHETEVQQREEQRVERAQARQKRIVNKYVTQAYEPKKTTATAGPAAPFSLSSLDSKVEHAKSNVSKAREELLSHPEIERANAEGKVVGPKGLSKLSQTGAGTGKTRAAYDSAEGREKREQPARPPGGKAAGAPDYGPTQIKGPPGGKAAGFSDYGPTQIEGPPGGKAAGARDYGSLGVGGKAESTRDYGVSLNPLQTAVRKAREGVQPDYKAIRGTYGQKASQLAERAYFEHQAGEENGGGDSLGSLASAIGGFAKHKWEDLENTGGEGSYSDAHGISQGVENLTKNIREASEESFRKQREAGGQGSYQSPSWKEAQAAGEIALAPSIASDVARATRAGTGLFEGGAKRAAEGVGESLRSAPREIGEAVRAIPDVLKNAPQAARAAAKEAPSAAGAAAKRTPAALGRGVLGTVDNSGKALSVGGVGAVSNRAGVHIPIVENVPAMLEGTKEALLHHPLETLETTGRVIPGFITGPASLLEATGESILQGNPKPLENTASALYEGTKEMGEHLLSGDPKEAEKAIRQEVGLVPYFPAPAVLRQLHGSDLYTQHVRAPVRKAVEERRSTKREKAIERNASDGLNAPKEYGRLGANRQKRHLKAPVPVPGAPGEHYVMRGIGKHLGSAHDRRNVALDASRASEFSGAWNQLETNKVRKAARSKGGTLSPLASEMGRSYEAAAPVMAKYGIPHTPEGARIMKELEDYYGAPADISRPDRALTDRMATHEANKYDLTGDKRHAKLTEEFRAGQKRLAKELPKNFEAKPYRIQNDFTNHLRAKEGKAPILKDTERVTAKAEEILGKKPDGTRWSRDEAWQKYEDLKARETSLRRRAREAKSGHSQAESDQLYKEARAVAKERKGLYGELKKFVRDPAKMDTSALPGASRAMKHDFVNEQRAVNSELGLHEPVHVHDEAPRAPGKRTSKGVTRDLPGSAQHASTGAIARSGEADARFENVLHHSAIAPRTQIALNELITKSANDLKTPVRTAGGEYKHVLTEDEKIHAENTHAMPEGSEFFPNALLKAALKGSRDMSPGEALAVIDAVRHADTPEGIKALAESYPNLRDEIHSINEGKGLTYVAVRSAGMDELVKQLKGAEVSRLRQVANIPTRVVLNDPAWVFAQLFATGIPIAAALGPSGLLRAPLAIKAMAKIQKMDPASQARIKAMIGTSAGVLGTPHGAFYDHDPYSSARAIKRTKASRVAWDLANGNIMGKWDRWNASKMREFAAAVRASKNFKNWYGGVKGLDKNMGKIAEATKGMSTAERLEWSAKHSQYARDVQKAINKIGGDWQSFTDLERKVQPFTVFYPWIRYSTTWVLHTFPMNHPVAATALAFLAQRNANELQKMAAREAKAAGLKGITASSPLSDILGYTEPVHRNAQNKPVGNPSGGRFSPLGVVAQTVLSGDPLKALQASNPWANIGISLATGKNTFTGQDLEGNLLENAAEQVSSLSPALRSLESAIGFRGFTKDQPQSAWSKAYEKLKGGKAAKREASFLNPYSNRPIKAAALENALSKVGDKISKTGSEAQSKIEGNLLHGSLRNKKEAEKLKGENKEAWTEFEKLLKVIDPSGKLAKQSKEEYAHYIASLPSLGGKPKSPFESGGFESSGSAFESNGWGGGKEKNLRFHNEDEGLHVPDLPSIPGLGGVTGAIGSLVGGTPAQAAELPKNTKAPIGKPANKQPPKHKEAVVSIQGPLTSSQKAFGKELVKQTGLDPKTVGGWLLAEDSSSAASSKQASGDANWLNIGPGYDLGSDPKAAAQYTANLINTSHYYGGIRSSVGKGVGAQVSAIQASPWDGAHYPNGIPTNLVTGKGGDVVRGQNKQVYVRADAKGMVQWAKANLGTQEGSAKQLKWASKEGLGSSEPWCANFVSNGLARRGVTIPANPNATESYEIWGREGKYASVVPGLSKAKPGDVLTFSGEHTALYVGNGEMVSGNFSDEVERTPVSAHANLSMVIRPKYKGGKVKMKAGPALPSTIPSGTFSTPSGAPTQTAISAYAASTGKSEKRVKQELKSEKLSPDAMLKQVERIYAGQLPGGSTSFSTRKEPDLAAIGRAVEESRRKLLAA